MLARQVRLRAAGEWGERSFLPGWLLQPRLTGTPVGSGGGIAVRGSRIGDGPLNALEVVLGPAEFVVSTAAFFLTEFLIQRWIGRTIPRQVEAGVADELSGG